MTTLTLKNIPDKLYSKIKRIAQAHRRSINSEILIRLERNLTGERIDPDSFLARVQQLQKRTKLSNISERDLQKAKRKSRT